MTTINNKNKYHVMFLQEIVASSQSVLAFLKALAEYSEDNDKGEVYRRLYKQFNIVHSFTLAEATTLINMVSAFEGSGGKPDHDRGSSTAEIINLEKYRISKGV